MDILANFSVKLTQEQLTQLVTERIEKKTGRKVKGVRWDITNNDNDRWATTGSSASVTIDLGEEIVDSDHWEGR